MNLPELHRKIRYWPTKGGLLFILATILTGLAAFATGSNPLFLLFSMLVATFLVSGLISRLTLAGLELELLLPEHVWARTPGPARIRLRNLKKLMPSFALQLSGEPTPAGLPPILNRTSVIAMIPGSGTVECDVEVAFPGRGRHKENVFVISTRFPFGLLERSTAISLERETVVFPAARGFDGMEQLIEAACQAEQAAMLRGPGDEIHRIRPYQAGEDARRMEWRSTARTGTAHLIEFASSDCPGLSVFLDRRLSHGGLAAFEEAIENCTCLISGLAQAEACVFFSSQGFTHTADDLSGIYVILRYLALVQPLVGATPEPPASSGPDVDADGGTVRVVFDGSGRS